MEAFKGGEKELELERIEWRLKQAKAGLSDITDCSGC
jgi:hypothetical protein